MKTIRIIAPTAKQAAEIELPLSKSISNRMLVIGYLAGNHNTVKIPDCNDSLIMKELLDALHTDKVNDFNAVDAGTVYRFLTALLSVTPGTRILKGTERMHQRPIEPLVQALNYLGADITYLGEPGYPPLLINGKRLNGGTVNVDASVSSQFISALMMVAPLMKNGLTIQLSNAVSRPYIEMTASLMRSCGIDVSMKEGEITILPGDYTVVDSVYESDWSAASYWFSFAALSGSIVSINGLKQNSVQGDHILPSLFEPLGVISTWDETGNLIISGSGDVQHNVVANLINNPDLAPAYAATCAGLQVKAEIGGLETLAVKESNRLVTIREGLTSLGYSCNIKNHNSLVVEKGKKSIVNNLIHTHNDHRIAMSMAILSIMCDQLIVDDANVVKKSYPQFWEHLISVGFKIELV